MILHSNRLLKSHCSDSPEWPSAILQPKPTIKTLQISPKAAVAELIIHYPTIKAAEGLGHHLLMESISVTDI